ncbi:MAG: hypothetical protein JW939_02260 [Candidatus Thermoplasmatota archaeon]|nr:hypothetical protein [Candidatus Thermoplasmatota archaeon]
MEEGPVPRFVCDEMLKRLARWLRIMGHDVVDPTVRNDGELIRITASENRVLLTRDRDLSNNRTVQAHRIVSDDLDIQLTEFIARYPPERFRPGPTRCPVCNGILRVKRTCIMESEWEPMVPVPADILADHDIVYECELCNKVYWTGSHWAGIMERLEHIGFKPRLPEQP